MKKKIKIVLDIETARETDRQMIRGIIKYGLSAQNWELVLKPLEYIHSKKNKHPKLWFEHIKADGIIVRGLEHISQIMKLNIPVIVSGIYKEQYPGIPSVKTDSTSIAKLAGEHLVGCGLWNFAYCGFKGIDWSVERAKAFDEVIKKAGFLVHHYPFKYEYRDGQSERKDLIKWVSSLPKPVGIMACNDDRALQTASACKAAGIQIPQEAAIIGVDNDEFVCSISPPTLSTVAVNFERAGFESAEMLGRLIKNSKTKYNNITVCPLGVIARQSTDILAFKDEVILRAIKFIQENFNSPISVDDVSAAAAVSRRVLEKRFKNILKRSINKELCRLRVNYIARLLIETDMTVVQIAKKLNYIQPEHICRYFKAQMNVSPQEYRKRQRQ